MLKFAGPWRFIQRFVSPILPIELRRRAQRKRLFSNRIAYLLLAVVIVIALGKLFSENGRLTFVNLGNVARVMFIAVLIFQLYAMISIVPAIGRDVDREFETKRVEFLLITSLSECEIVLGWLFRHVVPALATTFSLFPILATLATFASFDLLAVMVIEVALMLAFTSSAAICLYATLLKQSMKVMQMAAFAALLFPAYVLLFQGNLMQIGFAYGSQAMLGWMVFIPTPLLGNVAHPDLLAAVFGFHPFGFLLSAGELLAPAHIQRLAHPYWILALSLFTQGINCWLFIGLAAKRLRRTVIGDAVVKRGWRERLQRMTWRWRPEVWDNNPVLWKELFTGQQLIFSSGVALVALTVIMMGIAWFAGPGREQLFFLAAFPAMSASFAILSFTTETMLSERRSRCWEMLFLTGIPRSEILSAKLWASLLAAGGLASAALPGLIMAGYSPEVSWLAIIEFLVGTGVGLYVLAAVCVWIGVDAEDLTSGLFWSLLKIAGVLLIYATAWTVVGVGLVAYGFPRFGSLVFDDGSAYFRVILPMLAWADSFSSDLGSGLELLVAVPGLAFYAWLARRILVDAERRLGKLSERLPNAC